MYRKRYLNAVQKVERVVCFYILNNALLLLHTHACYTGKGVWYIPDMKEGMDTVKALDPYNENAVKIVPCKRPSLQCLAHYQTYSIL